MPKMKIAFPALIGLLAIATCSAIFADSANCPKQAIHCVYSSTPNSAKWIETVMLPQNITITLCIDEHTVLTLEKDDVKIDKLKPGALLSWQLSQCSDASCSNKISLGTDSFTLLKTSKQYSANPASYGLTIQPDFGKDCQIPVQKINLIP